VRRYTPGVLFTRAQYRYLFDYLGPAVRRLHYLCNRVDRNPGADPLYVAQVRKTYDELRTLVMMTHYRSCEGGVANANGPNDDGPKPAA